MSILETISKPITKNYIITLVGEGGMGKTSLAATFENPIFIRTEDGFATFNEKNTPDAFPMAKTYDDVYDQLLALGREPHKYKTVVIDSITSLNSIIETEIVKSDPKKAKSITKAYGGFNAGYNMAVEKHTKIKRICEKLKNEKMMNIVFIAHAGIEDIKPPDNDPYMRYTIRMYKKSVPVYQDCSDIVAFLKQTVFTHKPGNDDTEKSRATTDKNRIVVCYNVPDHISKNRLGITEDLPFVEGENPFKPFVKL